MEPLRHLPVPHVPGPARVFLFIAAVLSVVGLAALFGVARDYGYVRATLLTASSSGNYLGLTITVTATAPANTDRKRHRGESFTSSSMRSSVFTNTAPIEGSQCLERTMQCKRR